MTRKSRINSNELLLADLNLKLTEINSILLKCGLLAEEDRFVQHVTKLEEIRVEIQEINQGDNFDKNTATELISNVNALRRRSRSLQKRLENEKNRITDLN